MKFRLIAIIDGVEDRLGTIEGLYDEEIKDRALEIIQESCDIAEDELENTEWEETEAGYSCMCDPNGLDFEVQLKEE